MRTLSTLTLLAAATATLQAAGFTDAHTGASVVASRTYTQGVSADGTTAVGYALGGTAYKIVGTTYTALANLSGGSAAFAYAASSNGSAIVGYAVDSGSNYQAVLWNGASAPILVDGTASFASSQATGISSTGTTIVGYGYNAVSGLDDAFYYRSGALTTIAATFTGNASRAAGVSADGNLIVGTMADSFNSMNVASGFIYNITTTVRTIVDASALPAFSSAGLTLTQLTAISGNGQIAVGYAYNDTVSSSPTDALAFSYNTAGSGTYTALGKLGGAFSWSIARAVNSAGSVIVGQSSNLAGKSEAFVYQAGTMTGLGFLGTGDESDATGVSADGTVIVGYSRLTTGGAVRHAFVYTNVMLDETEWMSSLNGPGSLLAMTTSLNQLPLEGAHHRPLMSYDSMGKQSQVWATGDFGTSSRQSDRHMTSGEIGVSQTYGDFVLGIAAGHASLNQDLLFGGNASISGNTLLAEADYRLADKESIASLVLMRGDYDATASRGYVLGGGVLDASRGSTGLKTSSARLRLDGPAQKFVSAISATPFVSYTVTRTTADAYTETGGSFPASFAAQEHTAQEGRLGVTAKYVASPSTTLLFTAEWIHRFDNAGDGISGTNLATSSAFAVGGIAPTANQARFGFDVDHKLSVDTLLNFSIHAAGIGPSSDVSAALSLRRAF
jgi:probable HAF family extracellular repeat protein